MFFLTSDVTEFFMLLTLIRLPVSSLLKRRCRDKWDTQKAYLLGKMALCGIPLDTS